MGVTFDAAIFDFGGVLTTPILASFEGFEQSLGLPAGSLLEAFRQQPDDVEPDFHLLEKGLITEGEFYVRMMQRVEAHTGISLALPEDPIAIRRRLFGSLERNEEMIKAAARIGTLHKTAILSNNVREWTDWREMISAHIFDLVVDSSEEGVRKPDPEIYLLTCERLGVAPDRAVFIDDIPSNVAGAEAVGLRAIHFTKTEEVLAQLCECFPHVFDGTIDERNIGHA